MASANEHQGRPRPRANSFQDLIGDQHICAYRMAPNGTIIAASPALVRLLGYTSSAELCARIPGGDAYDSAYAQAMFARHGGLIMQIKSTWWRADGSIVHVRESATATYDEQGRPIHYDGIIEEIGGLAQVADIEIDDWFAPDDPGQPQPNAGRSAIVAERGGHARDASEHPHTLPGANGLSQLSNTIDTTDEPLEQSTVRPWRNAMSFPAAPQVAPLGVNLERPLLKHYAALLWRWSWLIVLCATLAGVAAFGLSAQTLPVYQSSTSLLINQARAANSGPDYNSLLTAERLAKTYAELMRKRPALDAVIANLKLDGDAEALAKRVSVAPVRDTQLLVLNVEDTDPQRAADIANQIVKVFAEQNQALQAGHYGDTKQSLERELAKIQLDIDSTQAGLAGLKSSGAADAVERDRLQTLLAQYRSNYATLLKSLGDVQLAETQSTDSVNVAEAARPESVPVRPRTLLNTLLGVIVGALLGVGMVFLVEYLDDRVKSSDQVAELTGMMTLGMIGRIQEAGARNSLVTIRNPRSPAAESYRMLRVNLDFSAIDRPLRTIAITSSGPAEGKTTTIANLAVAIAQTGKRVIVVDTDLRRPMLHKVFQLPNERGVTTALLNPGEGGIKSHLIRSGVRNLLVMTCGPIPPNPAELLGSQRMAKLIDDLKGHADVVLFDTPPLLVFADAALLAGICDGTLLVVRAGFTRMGALARAREQIAQSGARLLGVALNRATLPGNSYDSYYYYYAESADGQAKPRRAGGRRWPFTRAHKHTQPTTSSALEYIEFSEGVAPANGDNGAAGTSGAGETAAMPALATNGASNGHATPELIDAAGAPQSAASKWRVIYPRPK